ncbi:TonB-linked outer membrane protein, SusC/RagA family [Pseudarcicella hirudinis]|uniref:TonB-linked outer membrane protein, SusC/RagA family n=2 Tax=Pseudarcicella hirudinis TaxID=1079859 RepID=A0A1I5VUR3_9BACT|nr:TonB-dependent receptor [Pseudarcicella hirudinis]SFQ11143.1 TonB-linked outer membrane protein, SusC/RagA family [Pseudarcicella hirudinis]
MKKNRQCSGLLLTIMKISFYQIVLAITFVAVSKAHDGMAQDFLNKSLTLKAEDVKLRVALSQIEHLTNVQFVYSSKSIEVNKKVNINASESKLSEVLDGLLKPMKISFKVIGGQIILNPAEEHLISPKEVSLPKENTEVLEQSVSGKVIGGDNNQALPGVSIQIKGTNKGTTTDEKGNFRLSVPDEKAILIFTSVGYQKTEITVGNRSVLNVTLIADVSSLNEVVVVGYGTQKKVNLTGAVGTVNMEELQSRPLTNSSAALQGQIPGVYAAQTSGKPGDDNAVINIRGVGTLNNSNPLVLIDGFPANINDVNPQDIQTISVLKDASSAAIYGNRAANGVIIITTKRGTSKKIQVSYNAYFGMQESTSLPKVMNSEQYATLYNEASINSGRQPRYTAAEIQKFRDGSDPLYPNINYFDVYYDKAPMQNHSLSLTGGDDNLKYAFMLSNLSQKGILIANQYDRINFRSNLDAYFLKNKALRLSGRIAGNRSNRLSPADEWNTKWYATTAPVWPLRNSKGEYVAVIGERNFYGETMAGSTATDLRHQFNGQIEAQYTILDGLSAELDLGYNWIQTQTNRYHANISLYKLDGNYNKLPSDLSENNQQDSQTLLNGLLRYNKSFGKHDIALLAGYSEESFRTDWSNAYRKNFVNNTQPELGLGDAATMSNGGGAYDLGLKSVFGRVGYIFNNRYLFEANVRRDGSSRFREGLKWGTFPSFSAGWRISEENFIKDEIPGIRELKLRASWGRLGNQNINSNYAYVSTLSSGQNYTLGGALKPGVAATALANTDISWETTTQTNIGADLTLSNGFSFTLDYFQKKTDDILMQIPIPITMGDLTPPFQNVGKVKNSGIEFAVSYRKKFANKLNFGATVNLSHIRNEITDLYGRSPIINGQKAYIEGYAINSFYGYQTDGLYQISDFNWQNNNDASIPNSQRKYTLKEGVVTVANFNPQPGDFKFKDLNGDGKVTMDKDRTIIGKQFPDLTYSVQLNADWKGFDVSMFWQGVQGIQGYGFQELYIPFSNFSNNGIWWMDRWTPENPNTKYPRLVFDETRTNIHSDFFVENASYLRLKNIEIGYTLPTSVLSKIGIGSIRIYSNIQNALTFSKFKGFDPEQPVDQVRAQAYPQVRIYTLGLNVKF